MNWTPILQLLISFIIGGGLTSFVASLWKVRQEAGRIIVDAAQGAVIVQAKVIDELREELKATRLELKEVRNELINVRNELKMVLDENATLHKRLATVDKEQSRHDKEIKNINDRQI